LSANPAARHLLLCGCSVERVRHDYGLDLIVFTYTAEGEVESGEIFIQLKATDRLKVLSGGGAISFRLDRADLRAWLEQHMPVILVVYDAEQDKAYWLYVQAYFAKQPTFNLAGAGKEVTVHIPTANVLDQAAVKQFARFRDRITARIKKVIEHHE
jgi:hypothetical protein